MASQTLKADRDAYVDEGSPDSNFGGGSRLFIRSQGGVLGDGDRRLYCSFDLSDLPSDAAEILAATLRLQPEDESVLERTLRCHEVTGAWTEAGITWNTQPTVDTDHGTQLSTDDPQDWNVLPTVQGAFPGGRAEFRVKDETEGSPDGPEQEYISREGVGAEPELVLTFKREGTGDLTTTVTPNNNRMADLSTTVTPRVDGQRYGGFVRTSVTRGDGTALGIRDLAYDATRDALWATDTQDGDVVHRLSPDGTHEATLDLPTGFVAAGVAFDGEHLRISDEESSPGTIRRFGFGTDDEGNTILVQEDTVDTDLFLTVLAWDGSRLWGADAVDREVYKVNLNDGTASETHTVDADPRGLVFPDDDTAPLLLERAGSDVDIVQRDGSDFAEIDRWPYAGALDSPQGLALLGGHAGGPLVNGDWGLDELRRWASLNLTSKVEVGRLIGEGDLTSQVQPGNVSGTADLSAQVKPGNGGDADLSSQVTPRPTGTSDLTSQVQPGNLAGTADLTTTVRPSTSEINAQGRATGSVAPTIPVSAKDFAEIGAEIGSEITHTQGGSSTSLRRVVQLVDTQTAKTFPRAVTSEQGHSSTQDSLRRGDAILYAAKGDTFQPGDTVTYDGLTWHVVGVLGWELVGDERIYQEVGLRRVSVTASGRAKGTVQRSDTADLDATVNVNVP